ncbi:hypothetical protein [Promicromonospora sp. NPDC023805]|uniref:hypothetical protein n=1 Tax=Promicromonospora sp. NPDC023805 TaxID=3154696 RepID=UPI0033EF2289
MTLAAGGLVNVADIGVDSGWIPITLMAGFTGTLEGRREGDDITIRGVVTPNTNWGAAQTDNQIVDALPPELRTPGPLAELKAGTASTTAAIFRVAFNAAAINVRCGAATHTGGVYVSFAYKAT